MISGQRCQAGAPGPALCGTRSSSLFLAAVESLQVLPSVYSPREPAYRRVIPPMHGMGIIIIIIVAGWRRGA